MPGRRFSERNCVESRIKTISVKSDESPQAYSIYKKKRFCSENKNPFVVLLIERKLNIENIKIENIIKQLKQATNLINSLTGNSTTNQN